MDFSSFEKKYGGAGVPKNAGGGSSPTFNQFRIKYGGSNTANVIAEEERKRKLREQKAQAPPVSKPVDQMEHEVEKQFKWTSFNKKEEIDVISQAPANKAPMTHEQEVALDFKKATIPEKIGKFKEGSVDDATTRDIPYAGTGQEAIELGSIAIEYNKLINGDETADIAKLEDYYTREEELERKRENIYYKAGETVRNSLKFMTELAPVALTEYFSGSVAPTGEAYAAQKIAQKGAIKIAKDIFKDKATREFVKNASKKNLKTFTKQMAITGSVNIPKGTAQRMIGVIDTETGEVLQEGQDIPEALMNTTTGHAVEIATEMGGGLSGKALGALASPVKKVLVKTAIYTALKKKLPKATENQLAAMLKKVGWNGVFGEVMEERDADIANDILYSMGLGDQNFTGLTKDDIAVELIAFGVTGGGIAVANRAIFGNEKQAETQKEGTVPPVEDIDLALNQAEDLSQDIGEVQSEQPPEVKPEAQQKIMSVVEALDTQDETKIKEEISSTSTEDLQQTATLLSTALENATGEQSNVVKEHMQLINDAIDNRKKTTDEAVIDTLVNDKTEKLDTISGQDKQEAISTLEKISKTEHELAGKATDLIKKIEENNQSIEKSLEEIAESKKQLLAKKNEADSKEEKEMFQNGIDLLDDKKFELKDEENKVEPLTDQTQSKLKVDDEAEQGAIDLISTYVRRGDSFEHLKKSYLGQYGEDLHASIGNGGKITVERSNGKDIKPKTFSLKKIYDKIKEHQAGEKENKKESREAIKKEREDLVKKAEKEANERRAKGAKDVEKEDVEKIKKSELGIPLTRIEATKKDKLTKKEKESIIDNNKQPYEISDTEQKGLSDTGEISGAEDLGRSGETPSEVSGYDRASVLAESGNGLGADRATTKLTKRERQTINEQVESLLESRDFSTSQDDYTEEDRLLMASYSGAGGKESVGGEGAGLLNEYYTPQIVIDKMWNIAQELNPDMETAFEPSAGTGMILSSAPKGVKIDGAEISKVSGTIATILNPDSNITIGDFQELFFDKTTNKKKEFKQYDILIGNPPFGSRGGFLKGKGEESNINRQEEYFIKRGLDMTKEGGHLIYVVNSSFLKTGKSKGKEAIAKLGKLVNAYRLPEKAFADTSIGTDIVVFEKETFDKNTMRIEPRVGMIVEDQLFKDKPENSLGETLTRKNRFGKEETYVEGNLDEAISKIKTEKTVAKKAQVKKEVADKKEKKEKAKPTPRPRKAVKRKPSVNTIAPKKNAKELVAPVQNISNKQKTSPNEIEMLKKIDRNMAISEPTNDEKRMLNYEVNSYQGDNYIPDAIYYSGNIVERIKSLEKNKEKVIEEIGAERYEKQLEKLKSVMPEKVPLADISFEPMDRHVAEMETLLADGETKATVMDAFVRYLRQQDRVALSPRVGVYDVTRYVQGMQASKGTKHLTGLIKQDAKRLFNYYIKNHLLPETQQKLEDKYNQEKNSYVRPDYTEIPVEVKDMAKQFRGHDFMMSQTQKDGVSFLVNKGSGLLAYGVGVGKTHTIAIATKANMDKGWTKRPIIAVPKSTVSDTWIKTLHEMFPTMTINNFEGLQAPVIRRLKKERGEVKNWIQDGEITVISHDGLLRLGFAQEEITELTGELQDAIFKEDTVKTKRGEEKSKDKTAEILGRAQKYATDVMITDLGIDHISVDEVQNFRKVFQGAKVEKDSKGNEKEKKRFTNVIGGTPSKRAQQLFLLTQYIQKRNNNRNVFLASATPFENQATEVYNILSLIARDRMKEMGIYNINDFFAAYANFEVELDRNLKGEWLNREKMKSFGNFQSLQSLVREFIDFQEDETLVRPDKKIFTPHLQNSQMQEENLVKIQQILAGTYEESEFGIDAEKLGKPQDGAFLKASTYSMANSLSPYFIKEFVSKEPTAKELVDQSPKIGFALEVCKAVKNNKNTNGLGTFIYFGKQGVEYHPMIAKYFAEQLGYKQSEVAYISGKVTYDQTEEIKKKFNSGEIKVLLGGDQTKEGIDLQLNGFITINLALGWNPSEITQVGGRLWRQGNARNFVLELFPLIENSGDAMVYNKFEEKGARINQIAYSSGKEMDAGGEVDASEKKMSLLTNPEDKANLKIELDKASLENEKVLLENDSLELSKYRSDLVEYNRNVEYYKEQIKKEWNSKEEKANYRKELKKVEGKLERLKQRISDKKITDLNKAIELKDDEVVKIEGKIKDILETKPALLEKYQKEYQESVKKRKSIPQHVEEISNTFGDLRTLSDEELAKIKEDKIKAQEKKRAERPAFKVGKYHGNITDIDRLARLKIRQTPYKVFEAEAKKLLKQHGLSMNIQMFHKIVETSTGRQAIASVWGHSMGAIERVTKYTAPHEVEHEIELVMDENPEYIPQFGKFSLEKLDDLTSDEFGIDVTDMKALSEKRAELYEQYKELKDQLKVSQRLKAYFKWLYKQMLDIMGFTRVITMEDFFDTIYYAKNPIKGVRHMQDKGKIAGSTKYKMIDGKKQKIWDMELSPNHPDFEATPKKGSIAVSAHTRAGIEVKSYTRSKEMEEETAPEKPLIRPDGKISVIDLYKKVYNELYLEKAPAFSSLENNKIAKGMTKRAYTLGKRYANKITKDNFKSVQNEIKSYIIRHIEPKHRGELIRAVIKAKIKGDVQVVIDKVDLMVDQGKGRETSQEKKDRRKQVRAYAFLKKGLKNANGEFAGVAFSRMIVSVTGDKKRNSLKDLTMAELDSLEKVIDTLVPDEFGRSQLASDKMKRELSIYLPENLVGKEFVTRGEIIQTLNVKDLCGWDWFNTQRSSRHVLSKNEITSKVYHEAKILDNQTNDERQEFSDALVKKYKAINNGKASPNYELNQKLIDYNENRISADELSPEELDLANTVADFYADSIPVMRPNRIMKGYFTHTRETFLELVKTKGLTSATRAVFTENILGSIEKNLPPEIAANLAHITPNKIFNPYAQKREGIKYSVDYLKAVNSYASIYFNKKNFDSFYSKTNSVKEVLPRNLRVFLERWILTSRGRADQKSVPPWLKNTVEYAVAFEYFKGLGLNLASAQGNIMFGVMDNFAAMNTINLAKGHKRYPTPKGFELIAKYRISNTSVTHESIEMIQKIPKLAHRLAFFGMALGEHYLRGVNFLGNLTAEEFETGEISAERQAELTDQLGEAQPLMGRFDTPINNRTTKGKIMGMYLNWISTRLENWYNWTTGTVRTIVKEKGFDQKIMKNSDLHKTVRLLAIFALFHWMLAGRDRWEREEEQTKSLFLPSTLIEMVSASSRPVFRDILNIQATIIYLATQDEYKSSGYDHEKGDKKWIVYLNRIWKPQVYRQVEKGENPITSPWTKVEEKSSTGSFNPYK